MDGFMGAVSWCLLVKCNEMICILIGRALKHS